MTLKKNCVVRVKLKGKIYNKTKKNQINLLNPQFGSWDWDKLITTFNRSNVLKDKIKKKNK